MSLALSIIGAACPLSVMGLVAFGFWVNRGEGRPDVPGVRTLANFRGGTAYVLPSEQEASADNGYGVFGEGLIKALASALASSGFQVDAPSMDDSGWGVTLRRGDLRAYVHLGRVEDEGWEWVLHVVDPSGGGPCRPEVLPPVDAALKSLPGLTDILWYHRDRFTRGEPTAASSPLA